MKGRSEERDHESAARTSFRESPEVTAVKQPVFGIEAVPRGVNAGGIEEEEGVKVAASGDIGEVCVPSGVRVVGLVSLGPPGEKPKAACPMAQGGWVGDGPFAAGDG